MLGRDEAVRIQRCFMEERGQPRQGMTKFKEVVTVRGAVNFTLFFSFIMVTKRKSWFWP